MKNLLFGFCLFAFAFSSAQRSLEFSKIKDAETLDLSRMNLDSLPYYISSCSKLKKIDLSGNRRIKVNDTFKKLSKLPNLEVLIVDYCNLYFMPSVINEFKALKVLSAEGNGISWLPPTFKNLPVEKLNLARNNIDSLNLGFYSLLKLRELNFSQNPGVAREYNMAILASFPLLQKLILQNSKEISKDIGKLKSLTQLDLSGSDIKLLPEEVAKLSRLQYIDVHDCKQLDLSVSLEFLTPLKTLTEMHYGHVKFTVIPYNISKLKALKKMHVYQSSLGRLPSSFKDLRINEIHFHCCTFSQAKELFAEIERMPTVQKILLYDNCELPVLSNQSSKVVIVENRHIEAFNYDNTFNEIVLEQKWATPRQDYLLRTSKVYVSLKRNLKKNTFWFTVEPEYGYNEKQLQFWGDKVKAYPELKEYKGIRWNYTGSTALEDIDNIFILSEPSDLQKMKKKSNVNLYVLNLQDIIIAPNKKEDSYLMSFSRGFDTLHLKVLPDHKINDPKKLQNWHKNRYESYLEQRTKREEKWLMLDDKYVLSYQKYEELLEEYRASLNAKFYHETEK